MSVPEKLTHDALPRASTNLSMRNISQEDLDLLERDLLFYEKVSVCFLLHREVRDLNYILQQLTIALRLHRLGNMNHTNIISNWARNDPDYKWREHLIEALTIVKSHKVLKKLGFELKDVQEAFLPHIDEISVHVHPVLKILYKMCEKMRRNDRKLLIQYMLNKFGCENFGLDGENFLEMYLLNWIQQKIITIGDRDTIGAEFGELVTFLKVHEIDEYYEKLKRFTTTSQDATIESISPERQERHNPRPEINEVRGSHVNYPMIPCKMGYVVIINEKNFHNEPEGIDKFFVPGKLETRHGTEKDVSRLKETFGSLGFRVIVENDLTSDEILTTVSEYVEKTQNGFSSLFIVILSHGIEGSVYGANSIPLEIRSIKNALCTDELKDKPKILIVQACQNNDALLNGRLTNDAPSLAAFANLLIAHSTVEGFNAMRHTTQGTWFIQTLCDKIDNLHTTEHFLDILTHVTNEVANKVGDDGQRMIPNVEMMTLTKKLYLSQVNKF